MRAAVQGPSWRLAEARGREGERRLKHCGGPEDAPSERDRPGRGARAQRRGEGAGRGALGGGAPPAGGRVLGARRAGGGAALGGGAGVGGTVQTRPAGSKRGSRSFPQPQCGARELTGQGRGQARPGAKGLSQGFCSPGGGGGRAGSAATRDISRAPVSGPGTQGQPIPTPSAVPTPGLPSRPSCHTFYAGGRRQVRGGEAGGRTQRPGQRSPRGAAARAQG